MLQAQQNANGQPNGHRPTKWQVIRTWFNLKFPKPDAYEPGTNPYLYTEDGRLRKTPPFFSYFSEIRRLLFHKLFALDAQSMILQYITASEKAQTFASRLSPLLKGIKKEMRFKDCYLYLTNKDGDLFYYDNVTAPMKGRLGVIASGSNLPEMRCLAERDTITQVENGSVLRLYMPIYWFPSQKEEALGVLVLERSIHPESRKRKRPEILMEVDRALLKIYSFYLASAIQSAQREEFFGKDTNTGFFNKREIIYEILRGLMHTSARYNRDLSLLFIDIDLFKSINDLFGYDAGDAALKIIAGIMRESIRGSDTPVRLGGDEFVVFLSETNGNAALVPAERVLTKMREKVFRFGITHEALRDLRKKFPGDDPNNLLVTVQSRNDDHTIPWRVSVSPRKDGEEGNLVYVDVTGITCSIGVYEWKRTPSDSKDQKIEESPEQLITKAEGSVKLAKKRRDRVVFNGQVYYEK